MHGTGDVRFFDRVARLYDLAMPAASREHFVAGLDLAERPLRRVLDVGGGTGRAALALDAERRVVVDRSQGMLRRARGRGLAAVRGDARHLPVGDAAVDAVVIVDALHHMPDQGTVLAEGARVLAPGGVLVVREFDPSTLAGRGLVAAERLVGFGSTFLRPDDLARRMDGQGLDARVVDRGFGYTVAGVRRRSDGAGDVAEAVAETTGTGKRESH